MKITEIPTRESRRHLRATQELAGKESVSAAILRRELERGLRRFRKGTNQVRASNALYAPRCRSPPVNRVDARGERKGAETRERPLLHSDFVIPRSAFGNRHLKKVPHRARLESSITFAR